MNIDGVATFCPTCPLKGFCEGTIPEPKQHTTDANLFSISDSKAGINVSLGTKFQDEAGHKADHFPPHTTLDDISKCTGEEVDYSYGFLNLNKVKNCGAYVLAVHRFRQSLYGSPYPKK